MTNDLISFVKNTNFCDLFNCKYWAIQIKRKGITATAATKGKDEDGSKVYKLLAKRES